MQIDESHQPSFCKVVQKPSHIKNIYWENVAVEFPGGFDAIEPYIVVDKHPCRPKRKYEYVQ
jgi:hypothetical protein